MSENQHIIDEPSERTIRIRTVKYSGYVIETVVEDYELNEDTVLTRDVVEMPGAVAVAVLNERNELLMLNQYRHPVRMNLWEVPAGLLDIDGEDPLHAAQRELAEETDQRAAPPGAYRTHRRRGGDDLPLGSPAGCGAVGSGR